MVKEKDKIKVERLSAKTGDLVKLATLFSADGDQIEVGAPQLSSSVEAKVIREGRAQKVVGVKYKPKTREAKGFGHRQYFTEVEIVKI